MNALILAAGYGTRLYPETMDKAKAFLVCKTGKTFIDELYFNISPLVDDIMIITNNRFFNDFTNWSNDKENVYVINDKSNEPEKRLGALNDIWLARDKNVFGNSDVLFVCASDQYLDFSLKGFLKESLKSPRVMYYEEPNESKLYSTAVITINTNGIIDTFTEKSANPASNYVVPPFYIYRKKDLNRIEEAIVHGCNTDSPGYFTAWLNKDTNIYAYKMPGKRYTV